MGRIRILALATVLALPFSASAGTFTGWSLNGSAGLVDSDNILRLTPSIGGLAGSAWAPDRVSLLKDFSLAFTFRIHDGSHADGMTFTVQNADAGASALGQAGGFLGYQDIGKSVAFVFDTFDNGWDVDRVSSQDFPDNTSVTYGGNLINPFGFDVGHVAPFTDGLRVQSLHSWVDYEAATGSFLMYLNDTDTKPASPTESITFADIPGLFGGTDVLLGFTAGTGLSNDVQDIETFALNPTPVPLPAAAWLVAAPAFALLRRRRHA